MGHMTEIYAKTEWRYSDILEDIPEDKRNGAMILLLQNEKAIQKELLNKGWDLIDNILSKLKREM